MTREEANAQLATLVEEAKAKISEATALAKANRLSFEFTIGKGEGMYYQTISVNSRGNVESWESSDYNWNDSGCSDVDWNSSDC